MVPSLFTVLLIGLHESVPSPSAAFLGSCNGVRELASILLSINVDQLSSLMKRPLLLFFLVSVAIFLFTQPLSKIYRPY